MVAYQRQRKLGPKITPEMRPKLIAQVLDLRAGGMSYPEIGREVGYSPDTVRNLCREGGEPPVRKVTQQRTRKPYDPAKNHLECPNPACGLFVDVLDNTITPHNLLEPLRVVRNGELIRVPQECPASRCKYDRLKAAIDARTQQKRAA